MCGIGVLFSSSEVNQLRPMLEAINTVQHHRGPDGNGVWINSDRTLGFCHTRLSIIDLTTHSAQPLMSQDERYIITFNGEIYNYVELRETCISRGSKFNSQGDTEVILELYRHFGEETSSLLRGMWSFLIYDTQTHDLYISRDPFGIKPLFYGYLNGTYVFASEIKAFHSLDSYFLERDDLSIKLFKEYRQYDRGNWTFFKNIKKFPSSHHLKMNLKKLGAGLSLMATPYWDLKKVPKSQKEESFLKDELRDIFVNSVKLHMRSDVPVGFCLSGGIDSSSIVSAARQTSQTANLKTFTTRFPKYARIDETSWADIVNQHVHSVPHFIEPDAKRFSEDLKKLVHHQDEPFGSASIYSQYCIFRGISQTGVKVVLDGQGADEIFGGYHAFFPYYINSLIRSRKFLELGAICWYLKKNYNYHYPLLSVFKSNLKAFIKNNIKKLLGKQVATTSPPPISQISLTYSKVGVDDTLETRLQFLNQPINSFEDFLMFMVFEGNVPMLLRFEDRNSMAFSIESRVPFLINELVEFSLSIPAKLKMKNGITKYIFRASMTGITPEKILKRMDKLGFPAPDKEWMKEIYGKDVDGTFSDDWINLVLKTWDEILTERQHKSLNLLRS